MKTQDHTPKGIIERELSQAEIEGLALKGDIAAKKEIAKQIIATLPDDKIKVILELLAA